MTEIYERLISLFSDMGLDVTQGSYAEAEAYALASGINLVKNAIKSTEDSIFFKPSDGAEGMAAYAKMLGIDRTKTDAETLENAVTARISNNYGSCVTVIGYASEIQLIEGISITEINGVFVIYGINPQTLYFLGRFLAGGIPFNREYRLDGSGLTFSQWDSLAKTAAFYGSLRLPFAILDSMDAQLLEE